MCNTARNTTSLYGSVASCSINQSIILRKANAAPCVTTSSLKCHHETALRLQLASVSQIAVRAYELLALQMPRSACESAQRYFMKHQSRYTPAGRYIYLHRSLWRTESRPGRYKCSQLVRGDGAPGPYQRCES